MGSLLKASSDEKLCLELVLAVRSVQTIQRERNISRNRMTNRDNIIYYTLTAVVFIGIVVCYLLFHNSEQPITTGGSTNEEKQSMVEILSPYAPLISAVSVLISTCFIIWVTCFRKTRRDKVDEFKLEVLSVVCNEKGQKKWINAKNISHDPKYLSKVFDRKYHVEEWYCLLPVVLAELVNEGYHEFLDVPATTKVINQPIRIFSGSQSN